MYDCILPVLTIVSVDDESSMAYNLLMCFARVLTSLDVATPNKELAMSPTKGKRAHLERELEGAGVFTLPSMCSMSWNVLCTSLEAFACIVLR